MNYLLQLIADATSAINSSVIKEEVITDVDCINSLDITAGVYIIEEVNGDVNKTYQSFIEHKDKHYVAMPKSNAPSKVLYVGSSRNNLKQRLLQHAGYGYRKTYALHLKDWFVGSIKITVRQYDTPSDSVLQMIEDSIAFDLQPAFGKRGGNNK